MGICMQAAYLQAMQQNAAYVHSDQSQGLSWKQGERQRSDFPSPNISSSLSWLAKPAKLKILLLHKLSLWPLMRCLGSFPYVKKPTEMADEWEQGTCLLLWQQRSYQRCWQHCQTEARREDAVQGVSIGFWLKSHVSPCTKDLWPLLVNTGQFFWPLLVDVAHNPFRSWCIKWGQEYCFVSHCVAGRKMWNVLKHWELSLHKCVK